MKLKFEDIKEDTNKNDLILDFSDNDFKDLELLLNFSENIKIIDFSNNKIESLHFFKNMINLEELYLNNNLIENEKEIENLINLKNLKILFLINNKFNDYELIKNKLNKILPNLNNLDGNNLEKISINKEEILNLESWKYSGYNIVDKEKIKEIWNLIELLKFKNKMIIKGYVNQEINNRIKK